MQPIFATHIRRLLGSDSHTQAIRQTSVRRKRQMSRIAVLVLLVTLAISADAEDAAADERVIPMNAVSL